MSVITDRGKHFAAFACESGFGAEKAFIKLAKSLGYQEINFFIRALNIRTGMGIAEYRKREGGTDNK